MVATANTRTKRKNESTDIKTEPALKALKKNDIIIHFKTLQDKYEALENQNKILMEEQKNHVEAILLLEETVKVLEGRTSQVEHTSATVQTEIIRCEECEFTADDINDLVYHMYEFHPLEEKINNDIECNHCNQTFKHKVS